MYCYSRDIKLGMGIICSVLLEMKDISLSASCASDPTWKSSEMMWAVGLGDFYFLSPSSELAKQELYCGSLVIILTGLGGLSL